MHFANRLSCDFRVPPPPSDISCYSDAEADDRIHNRSRTLAGAYAMYSPELKGKSHQEM